MISSRRSGKCRYIVALPIPARRAMSSRGASAPRSRKTSLAAASSSSRVRRASARRGRRGWPLPGAGLALAGGTVMSAAEVHGRIVELDSAGERAEALALIDPGVIDHRGGVSGDHQGLAAWEDKWEHMYDGLRDVSATIEHNVASGDFSVNRYT